jgi:hypothetical protein
MENSTESKSKRWISYGMSGLVILFMVFDGVMKFVKPPEVIEGTQALGYGVEHLPILGGLALLSTLLYLMPRTAILGAVLLTGYFGGAMATHIRLNNPLFTHILFTGYLGILMWGGLWLRNKNLRALFPLQSIN